MILGNFYNSFTIYLVIFEILSIILLKISAAVIAEVAKTKRKQLNYKKISGRIVGN